MTVLNAAVRPWPLTYPGLMLFKCAPSHSIPHLRLPPAALAQASQPYSYGHCSISWLDGQFSTVFNLAILFPQITESCEGGKTVGTWSSSTLSECPSSLSLTSSLETDRPPSKFLVPSAKGRPSNSKRVIISTCDDSHVSLRRMRISNP